MRRRPQLRRVLKWSGTALGLSVLVAFAVSDGRPIWLSGSDDPNVSKSLVFCLRNGSVSVGKWEQMSAQEYANSTLDDFLDVRNLGWWPSPYQLGAGRWRCRLVAVPFWIPALAVVTSIAVLWYPDLRTWLHHPPGHCKACGYDLTGNESGACPECGVEARNERGGTRGRNPMRGRSRSRSIGKWGGLTLCLTIVVAFVMSFVWIPRCDWQTSGYWGDLLLDRGIVYFYAEASPKGLSVHHPGPAKARLAMVWIGDEWYWPGPKKCFCTLVCHLSLSYFACSLSILLLVGALPTAFLWYRDRRYPPGHCQTCGYDLTGNETGTCPECGARLSIEEHEASES
jgi:predicted Zn-ribbon and HTH transcriptional regulator